MKKQVRKHNGHNGHNGHSANVFDVAPTAVQAGLVHDVQTVAAAECGREIDHYKAIRIVRKLLEGQRSLEALLEVSTSQICRLVETGTGTGPSRSRSRSRSR